MEKFPGSICTIMDEKVCEDCALQKKLKCRFKPRHLLHFAAAAFVFIVPSAIGLLVNRLYWQIGIWFGFMAVFFTLWEIRILCAHCPYYAENATSLHCIANYGSPKVWKYHPEPMNRSEKIQLIIGFIFFGGWPLPWLLSVNAWLFAGVHLITLFAFFYYLLQKVCTQCVNFSCPLNRVPKTLVDAYLHRNLTMAKAWKEAGYAITIKTDPQKSSTRTSIGPHDNFNT